MKSCQTNCQLVLSCIQRSEKKSLKYHFRKLCPHCSEGDTETRAKRDRGRLGNRDEIALRLQNIELCTQQSIRKLHCIALHCILYCIAMCCITLHVMRYVVFHCIIFFSLSCLHAHQLCSKNTQGVGRTKETLDIVQNSNEPSPLPKLVWTRSLGTQNGFGHTFPLLKFGYLDTESLRVKINFRQNSD